MKRNKNHKNNEIDKPNKPHEHFFRRVMAYPQVAKEFLQAHLPKEISKVIDWNKLELLPKSFITDVGNELIADLVFKTNIAKRDAYIVILVEHQSTGEARMQQRIALKLLSETKDQKLVVKVTGLTLKQIKQLLKQKQDK